MLLQRGDMLRQVAPRQDAGMDFRLQRFDAAVKHLRKAGVIGHFGDNRHTIVGEQFCGAAGGQDCDAQLLQSLREFQYAGFVGDADQCLFDGSHVGS